jgi:hypothetical protein
MTNLVRELAHCTGDEVVLARQLTDQISHEHNAGADLSAYLISTSACTNEIMASWLARPRASAVFRYGLVHGFVPSDELSLYVTFQSKSTPPKVPLRRNVKIDQCQSRGLFAAFVTCMLPDESELLWSKMLYRSSAPRPENIIFQLTQLYLAKVEQAGDLLPQQAVEIYETVQDMGDDCLEPFRAPWPPPGSFS